MKYRNRNTVTETPKLKYRDGIETNAVKEPNENVN